MLCARRLPKLSYAQQRYGAQLGAGAFRLFGAGGATFAAVVTRFNWSYPKLLVYTPNAAGKPEASTLFPGFVFDKDEYVRRRAPKDFFYVMRRPSRPS